MNPIQQAKTILRKHETTNYRIVLGECRAALGRKVNTGLTHLNHIQATARARAKVWTRAAAKNTWETGVYIAENPKVLLKAAICAIAGTAIAVFTLPLAIAITAFVVGGMISRWCLGFYPDMHDLPRIGISVASGALATMIAVFVAELSAIGCIWLTWDFLSTFEDNLSKAEVPA